MALLAQFTFACVHSNETTINQKKASFRDLYLNPGTLCVKGSQKFVGNFSQIRAKMQPELASNNNH